MSALLPCPFCGGPAVWHAGSDDTIWAGATCKACGVELCEQDIDCMERAAEAWNSRAHSPGPDERDAARYRWLKAHGIIRAFPRSSGMMSRGGSVILADTKDWLPGDFTYVIDGATKDIDAAIDYAIAGATAETIG